MTPTSFHAPSMPVSLALQQDVPQTLFSVCGTQYDEGFVDVEFRWESTKVAQKTCTTTTSNLRSGGRTTGVAVDPSRTPHIRCPSSFALPICAVFPEPVSVLQSPTDPLRSSLPLLPADRHRNSRHLATLQTIETIFAFVKVCATNVASALLPRPLPGPICTPHHSKMPNAVGRLRLLPL